MSKKNNKNKLNQVRIIGGQFKRRNLDFIDLDGLRPTPDRLRETLFNWLMADIYGAKVLDACAGSGVLGFEALSRGASQAVFIEKNKQQYRQLINSAKNLQVAQDKAEIYCGQAEEILVNLTDNQVFNVVFLDPPYTLNLWQPILQALIQNQLINENTLIYLESDEPISHLFNNNRFQINLLKEKKMGQVHCGLVTVSVTSPILD